MSFNIKISPYACLASVASQKTFHKILLCLCQEMSYRKKERLFFVALRGLGRPATKHEKETLKVERSYVCFVAVFEGPNFRMPQSTSSRIGSWLCIEKTMSFQSRRLFLRKSEVLLWRWVEFHLGQSCDGMQIRQVGSGQRICPDWHASVSARLSFLCSINESLL